MLLSTHFKLTKSINKLRTVSLLYIKNLIFMFAKFFDLAAAPLTAVTAIWLKAVRRLGMKNMPISKLVLETVGILPLRNHYYEPLIYEKSLRYSLDTDRDLPGIDWNIQEQLAILEKFSFCEELKQFPAHPAGQLDFYYDNGMFGPGDAEYLYNIIRYYKPGKIIEVGSGHSTLMAQNAIRTNQTDDPRYACEHICIEPFEQPWLERLGIPIYRRKVEEFDASFFETLQENDILFIDSSHVIRPQGDVLFEYLQILPRLRPGVFVHIHDIFTPKDYPRAWVLDEVKLWNEQYLLEAFLSLNKEFRIIGALNYLKHHYPSELGDKCPVLGKELASQEPGSFWMVRQ